MNVKFIFSIETDFKISEDEDDEEEDEEEELSEAGESKFQVAWEILRSVRLKCCYKANCANAVMISDMYFQIHLLTIGLRYH